MHMYTYINWPYNASLSIANYDNYSLAYVYHFYYSKNNSTIHRYVCTLGKYIIKLNYHLPLVWLIAAPYLNSSSTAATFPWLQPDVMEYSYSVRTHNTLLLAISLTIITIMLTLVIHVYCISYLCITTHD